VAATENKRKITGNKYIKPVKTINAGAGLVPARHLIFLSHFAIINLAELSFMQRKCEMEHKRAKKFWSVGLIVTAASLGLIWFGVKMILQQALDLQSIFAFVLLAVTFGVLTGGFYALDMKVAFTVFSAGIIIGYFVMYWQFIAGMGGWGDLIGVLSLVIYSGISLAAGLVLQLIWHFIRKGRKR